MNATLVTTVLSLLVDLVGAVSSSSTIGKIINILTELLPVVIKEARDVAPMVRSIIETLAGKDEVTPAQVIALKELNAKVDAEFEQAAAAAVTEDEAAGGDGGAGSPAS